MAEKPVRGSAATAALLFLVLVASPLGGARLAGTYLEPRIKVDGQVLELVSCGVRDTLWIDHYVAGLYVPVGDSTMAVRNPEVAKAVRMRVVEARYLPGHIPEKWSHALEQELKREPMIRVRRAYGRLSGGDTVNFAYSPGSGVAMTVNGRVVTRAPGHGVINSILEAWAEDDPISGKLHRLALKHAC